LRLTELPEAGFALLDTDEKERRPIAADAFVVQPDCAGANVSKAA
jgi:hypothetical protein